MRQEINWNHTKNKHKNPRHYVICIQIELLDIQTQTFNDNHNSGISNERFELINQQTSNANKNH